MLSKKVLASVLGLSLVVGSSPAVSANSVGASRVRERISDVSMGILALRTVNLIESFSSLSDDSPDVRDLLFKLEACSKSGGSKYSEDVKKRLEFLYHIKAQRALALPTKNTCTAALDIRHFIWYSKDN